LLFVNSGGKIPPVSGGESRIACESLLLALSLCKNHLRVTENEQRFALFSLCKVNMHTHSSWKTAHHAPTNQQTHTYGKRDESIYTKHTQTRAERNLEISFGGAL